MSLKRHMLRGGEETTINYSVTISFKNQTFDVNYNSSNSTKEEAKLLATAERRLMEIWRYAKREV